jgi:hypothetical protein
MPVPIPAPWTALTRSGLIVTAPGNGSTPAKVFDFSHAPFADQFTVDGNNLLRSPITLQVQGSGGSDVLQTITAVPTVTSEESGQIVLTWSWTGVNNLEASGTITIQYDGAVRYDFKLKRTSSKQFKKIIFTIPYNPEVCDYLLKFPRPSAGTYNTQDFGEAGANEWTYTWADSATFPRQLWMHNTKFGLEWAAESDRHFGTTGWAGAAAVLTANQDDATLVMNVCSANYPSAGTADLDYTWWLTPTPVKTPASTTHVTRLGDFLVDTPAATQYRMLAEECPGMFYKYVGTMTPREGSWGSPSNTYAQKHAAFIARDLPVAGYTSLNTFADADPDYDAGWKISNGFSGYTVNCGGGATHNQVGVLNSISAYRTKILARITAALATDCEHIYFDVAEPIYNPTTFIDAGGTGRYKYGVLSTRELQRDAQIIIQAAGGKSFLHADSNFMACVHGCVDYSISGETYSAIIGALTGTARRSFYMTGLGSTKWLSEHATGRSMGVPVVTLPEIAGADYNTTGEKVATECCMAMTAVHNTGFWQSFSNYLCPTDYFGVLKAWGMENGAIFTGYWETDNVLAYNSEGRDESLISHWQQGSQLLVAIANLTGTNRLVPVSLRARFSDGVLLYTSTGVSTADGVTVPYDPNVTAGATELDLNVSVSRYGLALFAVTLDLAGTYTVGNGSIHVPGVRSGSALVTARPAPPYRPQAIEGRIKGY